MLGMLWVKADSSADSSNPESKTGMNCFSHVSPRPRVAAVWMAVLVLILAGCGRDEETGTDALTIAEVPWDKVRIEASRLEKPKDSVTRRIEEHKAALAEATYPVLVPSDDAVLDRLGLVVKSHLYTALTSFRTHRVEVLGLRSGKPDAADKLVLADKRAEISFTRWGVTYRVRVICDAVPEPDPTLCADGQLVGAIREKLVWINPR